MKLMAVYHEAKILGGIGHVGKEEIVAWVHEELFVFLVAAVVEFVNILFLLCGINGNFIDFIPFVRIIGFDKFGGFYFSCFVALKVVAVLVLHVEVECGVAEVLFGTKAFVPWEIFVVFGLRSPSFLHVFLLS